MTQLYQTILEAGLASATGETFNSTGCNTTFAFELIVTATVADLQATVQLMIGIEPSAGLQPGLSMFAQRTQAPTGITFNTTTGVFTLNNPSIGRSSMLVTPNAPFRLTQPVYVFTSGTGAVNVHVVAWGATFA